MSSLTPLKNQQARIPVKQETMLVQLKHHAN
jgi:hypothetical protein